MPLSSTQKDAINNIHHPGNAHEKVHEAFAQSIQAAKDNQLDKKNNRQEF